MQKILLYAFTAAVLLSSCAINTTPHGSKIEVTSKSDFNGPRPLTAYHLQKGNEEKVVFNGRNLIKAVKDNPSALSHARAFRVFRTVSKISFATFFLGTTYGIFGKEDNAKLAKTSLKVGMISLPVIFLTAPISIGHANKSVKVYNGF